MIRINDPEALLCHGTILLDPFPGVSQDIARARDGERRGVHAWVEYNGIVYDSQSSVMKRAWSIKKWRAIWKPEEITKYTLPMVERHLKSLSCGPMTFFKHNPPRSNSICPECNQKILFLRRTFDGMMLGSCGDSFHDSDCQCNLCDSFGTIDSW